MKPKKRNSIPVYRNRNIVATLTGVERPSANIKTGDMLQLSILYRKEDPVTAKRKGLDRHNCGICPIKKECYVRTEQMPLAVYRAVKGQPIQRAVSKRALSKPIRLGAYGDPAMLPTDLLKQMTDGKKHTGYSHQWDSPTVSTDYSEFLMASVETVEGAKKAQKKGYRTFRIGSEPLEELNEILCPNYTTGVQCADCGLCAGNKVQAKNIVIPPHGSGKNSLLAIAKGGV